MSICQGVCGEELVRRRGETEKQCLARKGCGSEDCDHHIRLQVKAKARIKNCKAYYIEPDCVEKFCLGLKA